MAIISNVTFLFAKVMNPVPAFNKVDSEWVVDVVCSKKDAKAVKKEFPKTSLKEYDNEEFQEKFGVAPPFPEQDEQFVLKFKKAHIKNGKATPEQYRPRVIQQMEDGSRVDITFDKLVGNGSKGDFSYRVKETKDYGSFVELQALLVKELVEYKSKAGSVTEDFGDVTLAKAPESEEIVEIQGDPEAKAKPRKVEVAEDEEDCDQLPF